MYHISSVHLFFSMRSSQLTVGCIALAFGMCPAILAQATFTHHWAFDGTLNDSIGTQPLTVNAGPTYVAGLLGQALQVTHCSTPSFCFSNTAAYTSNVIAPGPDGSFTLSCWFKFISGTGGSVCGYGHYGAVGRDLAIYVDRTTPQIDFDYFNSRTNWSVGVNPLDANWHNVIASYDGTNHLVHGYIDGQLLGTDSQTLVFHDATPYAIGIGARDTVLVDSLDGDMDDVYFGSGVATLQQAQNIWNNGKGSNPTGPSTSTIEVTTNLATSNFAIIGPQNYHGGGTSATFTNAQPGSYTIIFSAVGAYVTPSSQTETLAAASTIIFTGSYTVPNTTQTVFLIHGISQIGGENGALEDLATTLRDPTYGLDPSHFIVDAGFDWRYCADVVNCSDDCTIQNGARSLALYINQQNPSGGIIIIGYSMGGLIARDMILNDYLNVVENHHVSALITLATPNLGYPYQTADAKIKCNNLAAQMFGDFRNPASEVGSLPAVAGPARDFTDTNGQSVALSGYLYDLNSRWAAEPVHLPDSWYAVAGTFCSNQLRLDTSEGCPDGTRNDGVVCASSAASYIPHGPRNILDVQYSHAGSFSTFLVFCPTSLSFPLFDPPKDGSVVASIRAIITDLPPAPLPPELVLTRSLVRDAQNNIAVNLTLTNTGGSTARATTITAAEIGVVSPTNLSNAASDIAPSTSLTFSIIFPGSVGAPGAASTLTIGGTYIGGSFSVRSRITLP